ncbi:CoA transferase [Corticibacter populi]|uniref:CoA transferase n=1 Tax=Corticibacter populi TaxID=1550736 RepID=A0A3M6QXZ1_9BURK|nr:CoA transferase [Corticibacter populi]RMX07896.1 CoA transferase [Corticibacter populi]RZS35137.1 crotonobetainyl-CoA:carnitine CoA-transferase CaiB-like acyl-CoA transferase [Corticibacter populi]
MPIRSILAGVRILSLALNLPGPAALMRLQAMGAQCAKLEAPPRPGTDSSDPMAQYCPAAHARMHQGVAIVHADLKTGSGQQRLADILGQTDILLTSFRPTAMQKLGLDWPSLHARYPQLALVQIVGAAGHRADEAGHDLTYQAEAGLVAGLDMPPSLLADMAGALLASEAVLQAQLARLTGQGGQHIEVALFEGAEWLALPRQWGMTLPEGVTGGAHAGYRVYPCADGRVALAALEPHFALRLWQQASGDSLAQQAADMLADETRQVIAGFCARHRRTELDALAAQHDIPLHTMP